MEREGFITHFSTMSEKINVDLQEYIMEANIRNLPKEPCSWGKIIMESNDSVMMTRTELTSWSMLALHCYLEGNS